MICPVDRHIFFGFQVPGCLACPAEIHKVLVEMKNRQQGEIVKNQIMKESDVFLECRY